MDIPGPSKPFQIDQVSPFGFPEKEVIFFINSCGLSETEARDFMLFLTFANQMNRSDNAGADTVVGATAMVTLLSRLGDGTKNTVSGTHVADAVPCASSESLSHPAVSASPSEPFSTHHSKGCKPIFSKHNDVKFYPNIICAICKEWICSRSRRIHIGAHFDYRKYKCSMCEFAHSKEIFVSAHIRRIHNSEGEVLHQDDPVIEKRIESVCNGSILMTRDMLCGQYDEKLYTDYASTHMARSQIPNKERRTRTKVLSSVTETTNRQLLS